jgi:protein arginine N-methyltransferase 2
LGCFQALFPLFGAGKTFDAIYLDSFAEEYSALNESFTECALAFGEPEGRRLLFLHGPGVGRRVILDVQTRVVKLDFRRPGLETK